MDKEGIYYRKSIFRSLRGIIFLFLLIAVTLISISILFHSVDRFWFFIIGFGIILVLLIVAKYAVICSGKIKSIIGEQKKKDPDIRSTPHDALIIVKSTTITCSIFSPGIKRLIFFLLKEKYPFYIYYCNNPSDFKAVIENPNAKYLYIFGHGWMGGVTFQLKTPIQYPFVELLKEIGSYHPEKAYIAQFNCCTLNDNLSNESLPEVLFKENLSRKKYYLTKHKSNMLTIITGIHKIRDDIRNAHDSTCS